MSETGFLTLNELIELEQKGYKIFTVDEKDDDILKQLSDNGAANPVAIDLRLGSEAFLSTKEIPIKLDKEENEFITIKPGEFALLTTFEKLDLPKNIVALISMRFTFKREGLINVSGFHVDPGYKGRIIYSVYNAGPNPIMLKYKEKVFTIILSKIAQDSWRKNENFQNILRLKPEHLSGLAGTPVSPESLHGRLRNLEVWNKVIISVMSGLVIAVLVALLGR